MNRPLAYVFMALHICGAAGTYILGKAAATGFDNPAALTFARAAGSALILLLCTGTLIPAPRFQAREWARICFLGILLIPLNQYSFLVGLARTAPSHPALFYALTPMGVLCLHALLRRKWPSRRDMIRILCALIGVAVVLRPWAADADLASWRTGDLWIMGAVASWVIYTVAAAPICRYHSPLTVTAWSLIAGTLVFSPVGVPALIRFPFAALSPDAWAGLVWMMLVTSVIMMLIWNQLLRHLAPVQVAISANVQPLATTGIVFLLSASGLLTTDQDLALPFWIGMLLICYGVVAILVQPNEDAPHGE